MLYFPQLPSIFKMLISFYRLHDSVRAYIKFQLGVLNNNSLLNSLKYLFTNPSFLCFHPKYRFIQIANKIYSTFERHWYWNVHLATLKTHHL